MLCLEFACEFANSTKLDKSTDMFSLLFKTWSDSLRCCTKLSDLGYDSWTACVSIS